MSFGCPLLSLCHDHLQEGEATTTFYEQAVHTVLRGGKPDLGFLSELIPGFENHDVSPKVLIDRWYAFLGSCFILVLSGQDSTSLQKGICELSRVPFWSELQIIKAQKSLCSTLAGLPAGSLDPILSANGAAPFEGGGHWAWADVPFQLPQVELGLLWGILGILETNKKLLDAAYRIAQWQLKTLDYDGMPLIGIYTQEGEASLSIQLIFNYLLFRLVSAIEHDSNMAAIAGQQLNHLEKLSAGIPLIGLLIEQWIARNAKSPGITDYALESIVQDPTTFLTGIRTPQHSVFCTLAGGRTGLGTIRKGDVSIVTYGPQLSPLGDCSAFGIEAGIKRGPEEPLDLKDHNFSINRTVRLVSPEEPHTKASLYQMKPHPEVWAEVTQHYEGGDLKLDSQFIGFESKKNLKFTFFAKAKNCELCHGQSIKKKSLERYEGKPQPLSLHGEEGLITIIPLQGVSRMQIVPLAGDFSYWGAEYLISFDVEQVNSRCEWKISV